MSKKLLVKYVAEKLRTDTGAGSLVELTNHASNNIRIARDRQPTKEKLPYLGVLVFQSLPQVGSDVTHLQRSRVHFKSYSSSELKAVDIADRLETLLQPEKDGATDAYYDFSGGSISNRQTRWKSTGPPEFDEDVDVWKVLVEADLIWVNVACGN